jgi:hypothetical protein
MDSMEAVGGTKGLPHFRRGFRPLAQGHFHGGHGARLEPGAA